MRVRGGGGPRARSRHAAPVATGGRRRLGAQLTATRAQVRRPARYAAAGRDAGSRRRTRIIAQPSAAARAPRSRRATRGRLHKCSSRVAARVFALAGWPRADAEQPTGFSSSLPPLGWVRTRQAQPGRARRQCRRRRAAGAGVRHAGPQTRAAVGDALARLARDRPKCGVQAGGRRRARRCGASRDLPLARSARATVSSRRARASSANRNGVGGDAYDTMVLSIWRRCANWRCIPQPRREVGSSSQRFGSRHLRRRPRMPRAGETQTASARLPRTDSGNGCSSTSRPHETRRVDSTVPPPPAPLHPGVRGGSSGSPPKWQEVAASLSVRNQARSLFGRLNEAIWRGARARRASYGHGAWGCTRARSPAFHAVVGLGFRMRHSAVARGVETRWPSTTARPGVIFGAKRSSPAELDAPSMVTVHHCHVIRRRSWGSLLVVEPCRLGRVGWARVCGRRVRAG